MVWILREYSNKLLDAMENGTLDPKDVAEMCIAWMSERNVKQMCQSNDLFQDEGDDEDGAWNHA